MTGAPLPSDEYDRLLNLAHYEILDTPTEDAFDCITRLAARLLGTPAAAINFVDQGRQWSKSTYGVREATTPRDASICAWTILQAEPLVIEHLHADPRFAQSPGLMSEPPIHMYAGAPLVTPAGHRIGTLCVTDHQPHPLTQENLQDLQDLAALVMDELELRACISALNRGHDVQQRRSVELQRGLDQTWVLEGVARLMDQNLSPEDMLLSASDLLGDVLNADYIGLLLFDGKVLQVEAAYESSRVSRAAQPLPGHLPDCSNSVTTTLSDLIRPLYVDNYPAFPGALGAVVAAGVHQTAWVPLGVRSGATSVLMAMRLRDNPVMSWRGSDQALLEATGRSLRSALDRRLEAELASQQARRDPLTGLLNRRALYQDLIQRHLDGRPYLLATLDLDGLKMVNDREGLDQGDKLLQVFARTLKVELGQAGEVYRLCGDGFVVLDDLDEEAVHDAVDTAVLAARQVGALQGVSVGAAHSSEGVGEALLKLADERMSAVKRRRRAVRQHTAALHLQ